MSFSTPNLADSSCALLILFGREASEVLANYRRHSSYCQTADKEWSCREGKEGMKEGMRTRPRNKEWHTIWPHPSRELPEKDEGGNFQIL